MKLPSPKLSTIDACVPKRMVFSVRPYSDQQEIGSATAENTKISDTEALSATNVEWKSLDHLYAVNGWGI